MAFARAPCSSFIQSFARETAPRTGRPSTFNVLFARDLPAERDWPMQYIVPPLGEQVAGDTVLKSAILLELFGLSDCAYDTLARYSDVLASSFDLEHALSLLRTSAAGDTLRDAVHATHTSPAWRVTAPLRALGRWTRRGRR
jgi:hypothetical protein